MADEPGEIYRTEDGFLAVRLISQKKKPVEQKEEEVKPAKKKK